MYTARGIRRYNTGWFNALEAWEREHSIPLRLVIADGGTPNPRLGWVAAHINSNGALMNDDGSPLFTVAQGTERGITIWYQTPSAGINGYYSSLSFYVTVDDEARGQMLSGYGAQDEHEELIVDEDTRLYYNGMRRPPQWAVDHRYHLVIGEMCERNLYDWIGIARYHANERDWPSMHESVIPLYLDALNTIADPAYAATAAERREQRAMEAMDRVAQRVYEHRITMLRNDITQQEASLVEYERCLRQTMTQLRSNQRMLEIAMMSQEEDAASRLRRDFEALREHPRVQLVEFRGAALHIITTDDLRLTRQDTGASRWLGAFDITINLENASIRLQNLNTMRQGRHHPHVTGNGEPCFGGHHDDFSQLATTGEMYLLFELLLQYLETLNLRDSWGAYGAYWFDVADERPLEDAPSEAGQPTVREAVREAVYANGEIDDEEIYDDEDYD